MSAYKHPPSPAPADFIVSRCIGTCLRTYPPIGSIAPGRAKYTEHKTLVLCDGCISLSIAEGLFLFNKVRLLLGLTIRFMGVSALFICPYPGCFTTPFIMKIEFISTSFLSFIYRGVAHPCPYHQERITNGNSPTPLACPDILFLPVPVLPLSVQFLIFQTGHA